MGRFLITFICIVLIRLTSGDRGCPLETVCLNNGRCVPRAPDCSNCPEYTCECPVPYDGIHCEKENLCRQSIVEYCIENCYPCRDHQTCKMLTGAQEYACDESTEQYEIFNVPFYIKRGEDVSFTMSIINPVDIGMYEWSFGDGDDELILFEAISDTDSAKRVVLTKTVNHKYLVNGDYNLELKLYSHFNSSLRYSKIVHVAECSLSLIWHNINREGEGDIIQYRRKDPITVRADLHSVCAYATWIKDVSFDWKLYFRENLHSPERIIPRKEMIRMMKTLEVDDEGNVSLPDYLRFEPFTLACGYYRVVVKTQVDVLENSIMKRVFHEDTGAFLIKRMKLVAVILGGRARVMSSAYNIVLNGKESYDPDFPNNSLHYKWTCYTRHINNNTEDCILENFNWNQSVLSFEPGMLVSNQNYMFTLQVTSMAENKETHFERRSDMMSQALQTASDAFYHLEMSCIQNCQENRVVPTKKVLLKCTCLNCQQAKYDWDVSIPELGKASTWCFKKSRGSLHIEIESNAFSLAGMENFTVTCTMEKGRMVPDKSMASMSFQTYTAPAAVDPSSESCSVSTVTTSPNTEQRALETRFKLNCATFQSQAPGSSSLNYGLYLKLHGPLGDYPSKNGYLYYFGKTPTSPDDFVLPSGDPDQGYNLNMIVEISDSFYNTKYIVVSPIQVLPLRDNSNLNLNLKEILSTFDIYRLGLRHRTQLRYLDYSDYFRQMLTILYELPQLKNSNILNQAEKHDIEHVLLRALSRIVDVDTFENEIREHEQSLSLLYAVVHYKPQTYSGIDVRNLPVVGHTLRDLSIKLLHVLRPIDAELILPLKKAKIPELDIVKDIARVGIETASTLMCIVWQKQQLALINVEHAVHDDDSVHGKELGLYDNLDRDYFEEEAATFTDFHETDPNIPSDAESLLQDLREVALELMQSLKYFGDAIANMLHLCDSPILLPSLNSKCKNLNLPNHSISINFDSEFVNISTKIGVFVQVLRDEDVESKQFPDPKSERKDIGLWRENSVTLSNDTKIHSSNGKIQVLLIIGTFNPYLSHDHEVSIETPLLFIEIKDVITGRRVRTLDPNSNPHQIRLRFWDSSSTSTQLLSKYFAGLSKKDRSDNTKNDEHDFGGGQKKPGSGHELHEEDSVNTFEVTVDQRIFDRKDVNATLISDSDLIVYHLPLPPHAIIFVAIREVVGVDIQFVLKKDYRPVCEDFESIDAGVKLNDSGGIEVIRLPPDRNYSHQFVYKIFTRGERSSKEIELHDSDLLDYYITFWPRKSNNSDANEALNIPKHFQIRSSFTKIECTSKQEIIYGPWDKNCQPDLVSENGRQFIQCKCHGLSIFTGSVSFTGHDLQEIETLELFQTVDDNNVIPYVVMTLLFLYLFLLPVFVFFDYQNAKYPKLIVMTDITKIREHTFYLIVIETGNDFLSGTSANISCRLYGEKGRSPCYVFCDKNLTTARQNDEDRFLVSSKKDLGNLEQLRIWHDNTGHSPSWFCRKVIVRNIKTGKFWIFFVERWLTVEKDKATIICTVDAARPSRIKAYYRNKFTLRGYWHHVRETHIWLSPFTCPPNSSYTRAERFTTACTVLSTYMLLLLLLYGTPEIKSVKQSIEFGSFEWKWTILVRACLATVLGLAVAFCTDYVFRHLKRNRDRIPSLIVWKTEEKADENIQNERSIWENNVDSDRIMVEGVPKLETGIVNSSDSKLYVPDIPTGGVPSPLEAFQLVEVPDSIDEQISAVIPPIPPSLVETPPIESRFVSMPSSEVFRIPSTDIIATEKWIDEEFQNSKGLRASGRFIHLLDEDNPKPVDPEWQKLSDLGYKNYITSISDENPWQIFQEPHGPSRKAGVGNHPFKKVLDTQKSRQYKKEISPAVRQLSKASEPWSALSYVSRNKQAQVSPAILKPLLQLDPITESFAEYEVVEEKKSVATISSAKSKFYDMSQSVDHNFPVARTKTILQTNYPVFVTVSSQTDPIANNTKGPVIKVQLGEIDNTYQEKGFYFSSNVRVAVWWVCISIILGGSFANIYYGVRYSHIKSLEWLSSLCFAPLVSFFIMQPLKALWEYIAINGRIKHKKRKGELELFCLTKFKLLFRKENDIKLKIWPLNYLHYEPPEWKEPLSGSQIFQAKLDARRKKKLKKGVLNILAFIVILVYIVYSSVMSRDRLFNEIYNSLHRTLNLNRDDIRYQRESHRFLHLYTEARHEIEFHQTSSSSELYTYLKEIFIPIVQWEKDWRGYTVFTDPRDTSVKLKNQEMLLLGVPRLRQVRVKRGTGNCKSQGRLNLFQHSCDEALDITNEDKGNYTTGWNPIQKIDPRRIASKTTKKSTNDMWIYRSAEETRSLSYKGDFAEYPGGGYVAELGRVQRRSISVIEHLRRTQWIDAYTRAVFIDFVAYNPTVNVFASVILIVEIAEVQKYLTHDKISITRFNLRGNDADPEQGMTVFTTILFVICVTYLFAITMQTAYIGYRNRYSVRRQIWNLMTSVDFWISVTSYNLIIYEYISNTIIQADFLEVRQAPANQHISIQYAEYLYEWWIHIFSALIVLSLFKLWHLVAISNRRFFTVALTFHLTAPFLLGIFTISLVILTAFGFASAVLMGKNINEYKSISSSMLFFLYQCGLETLLPYYDMSRVSPFFGRLIFLAFNVFVIFVYINVLIAVLMNGLQEAKEVTLQRPAQFSYVNFLWLQIQLLLPKRMRYFLNSTFRGPSLTDEEEIEMEFSFVQMLSNHLYSIETQRMHEMRELTKKVMAGSGQTLRSWKDREKIQKKKILKFEEGRLNGMREIVLKFMKNKTRWDFKAPELKTYDEFNHKVLQTRYKKMEEALDEIKEEMSKHVDSSTSDITDSDSEETKNVLTSQ